MRLKIYYCLSLLLIISVTLSCSTDKKDWEKAKLLNNIASYNDYLTVHPTGTYSDSAQLKIWEKVKSSNTIASYNDYLKIHPTGTYSDSAKLKRNELQFLEHSKSINLIHVYRTFLKGFPRSSFSDSIQFWIEQIYNKRHPEFRYARTAKIIVNQNYGGMEKPPYDHENLAKRFMNYTGLRILVDDSEEFDVILKIEAKGKALSVSYSKFGKQYSGAVLSGNISFKTSKGFVYSDKFFSKYTPPLFLTSLGDSPYPTPYSAPWGRVYGSFSRGFVDMIYNLFGYNTLIRALGDENTLIRDIAKYKIIEIKEPGTVIPLVTILNAERNSRAAYNAIYILGYMKDPRAIEPLITSLRGEYPERTNILLHEISAISKIKVQTSHIREAAAEALSKLNDPSTIGPLISTLDIRYGDGIRSCAAKSLKKITGEDFGENQEKWQTWWEENQVHFLETR